MIPVGRRNIYTESLSVMAASMRWTRRLSRGGQAHTRSETRSINRYGYSNEPDGMKRVRGLGCCRVAEECNGKGRCQWKQDYYGEIDLTSRSDVT